MKKSTYRPPSGEQKRVYRLAKSTDIEKYQAAKALEHKTMLRAREIAEELNLQMKISDVEYQITSKHCDTPISGVLKLISMNEDKSLIPNI